MLLVIPSFLVRGYGGGACLGLDVSIGGVSKKARSGIGGTELERGELRLEGCGVSRSIRFGVVDAAGATGACPCIGEICSHVLAVALRRLRLESLSNSSNSRETDLRPLLRLRALPSEHIEPAGEGDLFAFRTFPNGVGEVVTGCLKMSPDSAPSEGEPA